MADRSVIHPSGSPENRPRKWYGKTPLKEGWKDARAQFILANCEHCQAELIHYLIRRGRVNVKYSGVCAHIVPERLILQLAPESPTIGRELAHQETLHPKGMLNPDLPSLCVNLVTVFHMASGFEQGRPTDLCERVIRFVRF